MIFFGLWRFTRIRFRTTPLSRIGKMLLGTWWSSRMPPNASHSWRTCLPPLHLGIPAFQLSTDSLHRRWWPSAGKSTRTSWPTAHSWHMLVSSGHCCDVRRRGDEPPNQGIAAHSDAAPGRRGSWGGLDSSMTPVTHQTSTHHNSRHDFKKVEQPGSTPGAITKYVVPYIVGKSWDQYDWSMHGHQI